MLSYGSMNPYFLSKNVVLLVIIRVALNHLLTQCLEQGPPIPCVCVFTSKALQGFLLRGFVVVYEGQRAYLDSIRCQNLPRFGDIGGENVAIFCSPTNQNISPNIATAWYRLRQGPFSCRTSYQYQIFSPYAALSRVLLQ